MGKKPDKDEDAKKKPDSDSGFGEVGARTDYDMYDWSGKQVDDHKEVRRKGSDR
jgi:hypothetical protein